MFGKILNLRLIKYSEKLKYYLKYGAPVCKRQQNKKAEL